VLVGLSVFRLMAFTLTALIVIVIPGPSVLFVVSRALAAGRRVAILSVLGNSVGEYAQVVAVAFGLGALAERSVAVFTVVKVIGGLYLIYLGIRTFRARRHLAGMLAGVGKPRSDRASFLEGVVVGATNPKTVVFMAAILPQFVRLGAGHVPLQMLLLGLVFSLVAVGSDSCWAVLAGGLRRWFERSPGRLEMIGGAGGLAIASVGAGLLLAGRRA
jgi:threonine/homoserine/homoserine lactone efflux protein